MPAASAKYMKGGVYNKRPVSEMPEKLGQFCPEKSCNPMTKLMLHHRRDSRGAKSEELPVMRRGACVEFRMQEENGGGKRSVGNDVIESCEVLGENDYVKAMSELPLPCNMHQVTDFLGAVQVYQEMIPDYNELILPLVESWRKGNGRKPVLIKRRGALAEV